MNDHAYMKKILALGLLLIMTPSVADQVEESPRGKLPLEELRTFANVFNQIRVSYIEEIDDRTLLENAIRGMLAGLDPHSTYLSADAFKDLQTNTTGEFSGLGIEITLEDGFVKVISPIDDTPAKRAGIEAGDLIIKLDTQPVKGLELDEAIALMRGPKGSNIDITIAREGVGKPFVVTITRDTIHVVSVRKRWLEPGYGYIRIAQFQTNTGKDLNAALASLMEQSKLKGLVLDLRNNPGGVLSASLAVASHFLEGGTTVYTKGRLPDSDTHYHASNDDTTNGLPLVVLINGGSASASEIVAGALQDHHRAVIMGTSSFGKGSVQTIVPLSQSNAIKLTTALYYTPNGRSIQARGITPDILVKRAKFTTLEDRHRISEADLSGHLSNTVDPENKPAYNQDSTLPEPLISTDNQLYEALTLLKGIHILGMNGSEDRKKRIE